MQVLTTAIRPSIGIILFSNKIKAIKPDCIIETNFFFQYIFTMPRMHLCLYNSISYIFRSAAIFSFFDAYMIRRNISILVYITHTHTYDIYAQYSHTLLCNK